MTSIPKEGMSFFIGENTVGLPYPVFYDPHYPIMINKPPVMSITGSPGSGKTFAGLTLASHASIAGKMGFIIDPKGDFTVLRLMSKKGYINNVQVWTILDPEGNGTVLKENQGMLDPLLLTDRISDNIALTVDIVQQLVGELTAKQRNALIPIIQDVANNQETASFHRVVQMIQSNRDDDVRSLGTTLNALLGLEVSSLLVRDKRVKRKVLDIQGNSLIVASLLGLSLPPDSKATSDYTSAEKVSVAIMGLLTGFVLNMMRSTSKQIQKILVIDEAWSVMGSSEGSNMIQQIALLGRSLNMACILITQSPTHLENKHADHSSLDTTIASRMAFRNDNPHDNKITCEAMRLPENEGWEDVIPSLLVGECLYKDCSPEGRKGIIHIMAPEEWRKIFETNPTELMREIRMQEQLREK